MDRGTKSEVKEESIEEKQTTKQILSSLNNCLGIPKRTKEVIKMYADYIKLYKKNQIKNTSYAYRFRDTCILDI